VLSEQEIYQPFLRLSDTYTQDVGLIRHRVIQSFLNTLGVPKILVTKDFRGALDDMLEEDYPALCCSSARAVLEGRIPGLPAPARPLRRSKKLEQVLCLMDVLETLVCRFLENQIAEKATSIRREVEVVGDTFGGVKLPRLMRAVLELEKENALKDKKAGKGNGRSVQGKKKTRDTKKGRLRIPHGRQTVRGVETV